MIHATATRPRGGPDEAGDIGRAGALAARIAADVADPPPPGRHNGHDDVAPTSWRWHRQSLSKGAPGIALLHAWHAAPDESGALVHRWLRHATTDGLSVGPGAGLWFGAPALAYAIATISPERYRDALTNVDAAVTTLTQRRLTTARARIQAARRPRLAEFDLVRGLTGLGAYLLRRDPDHPLLRDVLRYLVALTRPLPAGDAAGPDAPGWWSSDPPPSHPATGGGHANLGMAHGIAGPLALLALALRAGIIVPGHAKAIERITGWLDAWRQDAPTGLWWPEHLTVTDLHTGRPAQAGPARPSWCYGTPGLARAQQLAALAISDQPRQAAAEHALTACLRDPAQLDRLTDPALCHGWAGVVLSTWCAAADAATPGPAQTLPSLTRAFLAHTDSIKPTSGLAHAHLDRPDRPEPTSGLATARHADSRRGPTSPQSAAGLIDGRAGVALVAHTLATADTHPAWASCLLLT
ncbi:class I lanthipeptide synthase [Frankia sp. AiPs1]|uniref:lanthionine synthetase C family protein n=1 Tax=Frankia sp. AiPa1 TaxID=573492 RepID=UPI00202B0126|nr:lanthionine synthetase C family protein [Frankia sp. AiPa1]MCL9762775.1 lanthionine synthetase C family protein [Frankia sp. AiPa1]